MTDGSTSDLCKSVLVLGPAIRAPVLLFYALIDRRAQHQNRILQL